MKPLKEIGIVNEQRFASCIKLAVALLMAVVLLLEFTPLSSSIGLPFGLHSRVHARSPIIVNSTETPVASDGLCTLFEAIVNANRNQKVHPDCEPGIHDTSAADIITFDIPGPGPHTIKVQKGHRLIVSESVLIDGLSQPANGLSPATCGKNRNLLISLSGITADETSGITVLKTRNVTIRGLNIHSFRGSGIQVRASNNVHIMCNHIGTDIGAMKAAENWVGGILISNGSLAVTVGTDGDGDGDSDEYNVISGNRSAGIIVSQSSQNVIAGNRIGTNLSGINALPNEGHGIMVVNGSQDNRIGTNSDKVSDGDERNIIAGNLTHGVTIRDPETEHTTVSGNYIGTNIFGSRALPNLVAGINITEGASNTTIGGRKRSDRNIISGNESRGVWVHSSPQDFKNGAVAADTQIQNNLIGLDVNRKPLGNRNQGILLELAASVQIADNDIANNLLRGIYVVGAEAFIVNNRIARNGNSGIEITFHQGRNVNAKGELYYGEDVISSVRILGNVIDGNCTKRRRCAGILGVDDSIAPGDTSKGKTVARANIIKDNNGRADIAQYWYVVIEALPSMEPYTQTLTLRSSLGKTTFDFSSSGKKEKGFKNKVLYVPRGFQIDNVMTWQLLPDFLIDKDNQQLIYSYSTESGESTWFERRPTNSTSQQKRADLLTGIQSNLSAEFAKANNKYSLLRYKILKLQKNPDTTKK